MTIRTILATVLLGACGALASCSDNGTTNPSTDCGNNAIDGSETCDGSDLGGASCDSLGFGTGTLKCSSDCKSFDSTQCGAPSTCGNGVKDGVESCDGSDLGGQTCNDLGLGAGNLGCQLNCLGFDSSNCAGPASCGNGVKDGAELCDGVDLGGKTCETAGAGTGTLGCSANCSAFDTSGCVCVPACSGIECGVDPLCGESCGKCALGSMCDMGKCVEICDLPRVVTNTTLNLDATTVTLSGQVTLNGLSMLNDSKLDGQPRGRLRLRNTDTFDDYDIDLGETGSVNYSVKLFAGTYDVYIHGNYDTVQTVLPSNKDMLVQRGLELKTNTTLNFDAKTLKVSGNVLLNGATMPNDTKLDGQSRGRLRFHNAETFDDYDIDLGESGAVSYSQTVFAGKYDIYVHGNYDTVQTVLPSNKNQLIQGNVALSTNTTKDIDAKTLVLTGKLTLNGATMPSDTKLDGQSRGRLRFRNIDTFDDYDIDLGENGGVNYTQTLFAGPYDVYVHGNYDTVQTVLPSNKNQLIQKAVGLSMTGTKDFDAKTLVLSGQITLNGATMPNDTKLDGQPRGRLRFRNTDTIDDYDINLGESGAVNYTQTLFVGPYDVYIHGNYDTVQTVLPSNKDMLAAKGLALTATGTKDFDAKTLTIMGNVTLNLAAMPNDTILDGQPRGRLRFRNMETVDDYDINLGESGAVSFSQKLFAGLYAVYVHGNYNTVQSVLPSNKDMLIQKSLALSTNTTQNFDARTATVNGILTLNGLTMPNDTKLDGQPRGRLRFRNVETIDDYDIDLAETGAVMYSQKLFVGSYDVFTHGNYDTVQTVLPSNKDQRILKGCLTK